MTATVPAPTGFEPLDPAIREQYDRDGFVVIPNALPEDDRAYFEDAGRVWRELRVIPQEYRIRGDQVLALGRVYARGLDGAIVDSPAGWVWRLEQGRVAYARAFERPEEAVAAFDASA